MRPGKGKAGSLVLCLSLLVGAQYHNGNWHGAVEVRLDMRTCVSEGRRVGICDRRESKSSYLFLAVFPVLPSPVLLGALHCNKRMKRG